MALQHGCWSSGRTYQVVKTINSAKQDAHWGGCLRSPQGTSPSLPWGRNQETAVSAAFSPSNRADQVSPSPEKLLNAALSSYPLIVWTQSCLPSPATPSRSLQNPVACPHHPGVQHGCPLGPGHSGTWQSPSTSCSSKDRAVFDLQLPFFPVFSCTATVPEAQHSLTLLSSFASKTG